MRGRSLAAVGARAAELESLKNALHRAYDARDGSRAADAAWGEAAAAFRAAVAAFYQPYEVVLIGVKAGRPDAIEAATEFLVADPWCFRSGYLKAELMHALANAHLPVHVMADLQHVVVRRVTNPQPRLLRYAGQLAANLWDDELEAELLRLEVVGSNKERLAAARVLVGARQRLHSLAGQPRPPMES